MIFQNDWFCWKWGDWNGCSYCFDDDDGSDEDDGSDGSDEDDGSMMVVWCLSFQTINQSNCKFIH